MIQVGDKYKTTAVFKNGIWYNFGIHPKLASVWGRKPEDIRNVEITVKEIDVLLKDWYKSNDENEKVYFGYYDYKDGYCTSLMCCNVKVYNCCFPYSADNYCFKHIKGVLTSERTGTTFIFEVEEIC